MSYLSIGLPKWPAMVVRGTSVTVEQAKDILRRTDLVFLRGYWGNDDEFNRELAQILDLPKGLRSGLETSSEPWSAATYEAEDEAVRAWQAHWGCVETQYVVNSWIACAYIGGPHGWCHPNGTIRFDTNIGKYPSVEAVLKDWTHLAEAFPYLDLTATLMDREYCEENPIPLVSIRVVGGTATPCDPLPVTVDAEAMEAAESLAERFTQPHPEFGLPLSWIQEWAVLDKRPAGSP